GQGRRASERAILIWSSEEGAGGAHCAALARELGFAAKPGSGAFHLPRTANGRGGADAWAAASDGEGVNPEPISLLVVSGDEAAADPNVSALAERAEHVLAISMFRGLVAGGARRRRRGCPSSPRRPRARGSGSSATGRSSPAPQSSACPSSTSSAPSPRSSSPPPTRGSARSPQARQ